MKKAFTLLEVILAFGLMAILAVTSTVLLFSVLEGARKSAAIAVARSEGAYAIAAISNRLRYAKTVNCLNGGINLQATDSADLVTVFNWNGGGLAITNVDGSNRVALTSSKVQVTASNCPTGVFTCSGAIARFVNICFDVAAAGGSDVSDNASVPFSSQVALRNFGN